MVFTNEWDDYNLHYFINRSSYNNEITRRDSSFVC